jgi:hypothetical protein
MMAKPLLPLAPSTKVAIDVGPHFNASLDAFFNVQEYVEADQLLSNYHGENHLVFNHTVLASPPRDLGSAPPLQGAFPLMTRSSVPGVRNVLRICLRI